MTINPEVNLTLDDAVEEVLGMLTGLDLRYAPELDRYRAITRQLNRALRANALEKEWSYYASTEVAGTVVGGETEVLLRSGVRPRIINDDAVRLVDADGRPRVWAYFLPRDALHKYRSQPGLWCSVTRSTLQFSKPLHVDAVGWEIHVPVMREPTLFRLPDQPEDPSEPLVTVPAEIREQPIDFAYPDVITLRAAFYYAQTDPVMQPRVQTLEAQYKDLMYQLMERDDRNTDSPFQNNWVMPLESSTVWTDQTHMHPHAGG